MEDLVQLRLVVHAVLNLGVHPTAPAAMSCPCPHLLRCRGCAARWLRGHGMYAGPIYVTGLH